MTKYASIEKPWLKYYPQYIIDRPVPKDTIYNYLLTGNNFYPKRCALSYFGKKISYLKLIENIDITARALIAYGIKEGDIITICTPSVPEFVYLFYASSKIGAICNMIDPRKSKEEIIEYTNSVNSNLFIIIDVALDKIIDIEKYTKLNKIIALSPADSMPNNMKFLYKLKGKSYHNKDKNIILWKDFFKTGIERKNEVIIDKYPEYKENKPMVIVYTGGTTGKSKGVVLSNDNLNSTVYQCNTCGYDFQRQHKWLDIMPPFIAYGVGTGLHLPLSMGMEVVLIPNFDLNKFDRLLYKYKPNHITGTPTHYDSLLKSKKFKKESLNFLLAPIVGGDKLNETSEDKINEFFKKHDCNFNISKGYGMSEVAAAVCSTCIPDANKRGSVGIPYHHTIIASFDTQTGKEMPIGQEGEICITGPNTMIGYYNNEKETNNILRKHEDGLIWVHSGDIGYIDEDGAVFIKGRIKEMIIRYDGFKVFPILIEEAICTHPLVKNCKVVGIKDKNYSQGEVPRAFIEVNDTDKTKEEIIDEIKEICQEKLAEYLQPDKIVIKDKLPLTSIGKIDYRKLKEEDE